MACSDGFTTQPDPGAGGAATSSSSGSQGGGGSGGGGSGGGDCEADLEKDPQHCGACNHDCLGGDCQAGACQPIELYDGQPGVIGLAVSGATLYWSVGAEIRHAPLAGGAEPSVYLTGATGIGYVAVREGWLYWTEGKTELRGKELGGDGAFAVPANAAHGVAVDDERIYWTEYVTGGRIRAVLLGDVDGTQLVLSDSQNSPEGIAVTPGGAVLWAHYYGGELMLRSAAGDTTVLSATEPGPAGVATDGEWVYWGTQTDDGSIKRMTLPGGPIEILAESPGTTPTGIALTDTALIWADYDSGTIHLLAL